MNKTDEVMQNGDLEVDSIHSAYLGRHIIRVGDRDQKIYRSYDPMSECYHLNSDLFDNQNISVQNNVTMSGCFKSNKVTLQRTMIPDIDSPFSSLPTLKLIKEFEPAVKSVIRKLKIEQLAECFIDDLNLTSFNSKTFPGFHLNNYFRHSNKEEASSDAMKIAKERWKYIDKSSELGVRLKRNKLFPNTFVVGARNKREYDFLDNENLSSRAVHMPEFPTEIHSSIWLEQITNQIRSKNRGPIYIGNSIVSYDRLIKDLSDHSNCIEGDWKRFDSRLYIINIIIGIAILRLYYPLENNKIDYHFLAIFDTIGIKDYITPGGHLYRMMHGLPSGVSGTSLIGSIINFVNLSYCTKDFDSRSINYVVGGDDFLIALKNSISYDDVINKMNYNSNNIGQVFKFLIYKDFYSKSILDRPCFFKYTIDRNEPVVFPTALLERTFMPWNKRYNNNNKVLSFLDDLIPSLGSPRTFHLIFYHFYCDIFKKVTKRSTSIGDVYNKHLYVYRKVLSGRKYYREDKIRYFENFSLLADNNKRDNYFKKFLNLTESKIIRLKVSLK